MPRWVKLAGGALIVMVIVVGIAIWQLFANLNDIIRAAIETVGSDLTGTEVALDDVDISLQDGTGELRGFRVVNPNGFSRADAFRFAAVSVKIDPRTVLDDVVVINDVTVVQPVVTYELAGESDNLNTLKSNTEANAERMQKKAAGGAPAAQGETADGQKFIIERVRLLDGTVNVKATQLTDRSLSVPLPDIELRDVGKDEGGAGPDVIAGEVMNGLLDKVTSATDRIDVGALLNDVGAAAGELADEASRQAGEAVDAVGQTAGDAAESVERGAGDAAKDAEKALEDAGKAVKGLFGN